MKRRWTSEIRPSGKSATRRTCARPAKASTAAPPVSPEVAQTMVSGPPSRGQRVVVEAGQELHGDVLEGQRRAVEQLEQEAVRARAGAAASTAGWSKAGVGLGADRRAASAGRSRRRRSGRGCRRRPRRRAGRRRRRSRSRVEAAARSRAHRGRRPAARPASSASRKPTARRLAAGGDVSHRPRSPAPDAWPP